MSMKLSVWDTGRLIGELVHDSDYNRFSFAYSRQWVEAAGYPLSPKLPLTPSEKISPERHSADVRNFFQNLLAVDRLPPPRREGVSPRRK